MKCDECKKETPSGNVFGGQFLCYPCFSLVVDAFDDFSENTEEELCWYCYGYGYYHFLLKTNFVVV